jgi:hypothetical protein
MVGTHWFSDSQKSLKGTLNLINNRYTQKGNFMKIKQILLTITAIVTSVACLNNAYADGHTTRGNHHVGIGYSQMNSTTVAGTTTSLNLSSVSVALGTALNDNFSVEARFGLGSKDHTSRKIDKTYGAYLKAGMYLSQNLYPYAILGYSKANIRSSADGSTVRESDVSVGLGINVDFMQSDIDVALEYMRYVQETNLKMNSLSASLYSYF